MLRTRRAGGVALATLILWSGCGASPLEGDFVGRYAGVGPTDRSRDSAQMIELEEGGTALFWMRGCGNVDTEPSLAQWEMTEQGNLSLWPADGAEDIPALFTSEASGHSQGCGLLKLEYRVNGDDRTQMYYRFEPRFVSPPVPEDPADEGLNCVLAGTPGSALPGCE